MTNALLICACLCAVACLYAWRWPPHATLSTHIDIDATPEQIWELLGQPTSYPNWNPFIVSMQGHLAVGQQLVNVMQPTGKRTMTFKPRLLAVDAPHELRWRGRLLVPGLFDGEHFFELHRNANGTQLHHGEKFSGLLLWLINVETFRQDFERMNAALKIASESLSKKMPSHAIQTSIYHAGIKKPPKA